MLPWQQLCIWTTRFLENRIPHFKCFCKHGMRVCGLFVQSMQLHTHQIYRNMKHFFKYCSWRLCICVICQHNSVDARTSLTMVSDVMLQTHHRYKFKRSYLCYLYEGCSNMNASSFITFFTYML